MHAEIVSPIYSATANWFLLKMPQTGVSVIFVHYRRIYNKHAYSFNKIPTVWNGYLKGSVYQHGLTLINLNV